MQTSNLKCIYCKCSLNSDSLGKKGDHIIPKALGEFDPLQTYKGVCTKCNNALGKIEGQWIHTSIEGFLRSLIIPPTKKQVVKYGEFPVKHETQKNYGSDPYIFVVPHQKRTKCKIACKYDIENKGPSPIPQIILQNRFNHNSYYTVYLSEQMRRRDNLCSFLNAKGLIRHKFIDAILPLDANNHRLFQKFFPKQRLRRAYGDGDLIAKFGEVELFCKRDKCYFRVAAKVGFHFYLKNNNRELTGDEDIFEKIKLFIFEGKGQPEEFFDPSVRSIPSTLNLNQRLTEEKVQHSHIVYFEESSGSIYAGVHWFCGPANQSGIIKIKLADKDFKIASSMGQKFQYCDGERGEVVDLRESLFSILKANRVYSTRSIERESFELFYLGDETPY